jgi:hypothetical protein
MELPCKKGFSLTSLLAVLVLTSEILFAVGIHLPYGNKTFNETVYGSVSRDDDDLWKYEYTRSKNTVSEHFS